MMNVSNRTQRVRYEVNVCGGTFEAVNRRFQAWKDEPLVYRPERRMFEGKDEVRRLGDGDFDDADDARRALQRACSPKDPYALAAFVHDDGREMWVVMAAYDDSFEA